MRAMSFYRIPLIYRIPELCTIHTPKGDKPEYYYVYAKLPQQLQEKGDYFNQADSLLDVMEFTEAHLSVLFVIFILGL